MGALLSICSTTDCGDSDMHGFTKPDGVTDVRVDRVTGRPADSSCPNDYTAAFLEGTIPAGTCSSMSESPQSVVEQMLNSAPKAPPQPPQ